MRNLTGPIVKSETEITSCPLCGSSNDSIIHSFGELNVVSCRDCGLRYLNPRIRESAMRKRYEHMSYFSGGGTAGYDDYHIQEVSLRLTFRRFLGNLRKAFPKFESLLEVGCGYGFFLDEARAFFPRRTGVELSAEAGATAEKASGAHVYIGDVSSLPPEMKDLDIIAMINVIEHVYEPIPLLVSLRERLTAEGVVVVATPDIGSFWYRIMRKRWPSFKIPEHVAFYNKKNLEELLHRAGFETIGAIPFPHAFPLGVITEKFGINLPPGPSARILWMPRVMLALAGRKRDSMHGNAVRPPDQVDS